MLTRAEWAVKDRREPIVAGLDLVLAWADLHGEEPAAAGEGGDRLVRLGGDGTPLVRDLCLELAVARGEHVHATRSLMADVLDLRHRTRRTWTAVRALRLEPWVARKVASMSRKVAQGRARSRKVAQGRARSRKLDADAAALVDAALAEAATSTCCDGFTPA